MAVAPVFRATSGLNNVIEPHRLKYGEDGGCPLAEAVNVVVHQDGSVRRRHPKRKVVDGASHSFWSRGEYAFFCRDGKLYRLMPDESTLLVASVGAAEMSYAEFMGKIYVTNGTFRAVIDGTMIYPWTASVPALAGSDTRQLGLPSVFSRIFAHAGRMCLVDGAHIWIGEPFNAGCYDLAAGPISLNAAIVDFASVESGIYVSDANLVYFVAGKNRAEMSPMVAHDEPMVRGTCLSSPLHALKLVNFGKGAAAVWVSRSGILVGLPSGEVVNISDDKLRLPIAERGQACIYDGYYIFSLEVI